MSMCNRARELATALQEMLTLLEQEGDALRARDIDTIEALSQQKNTAAKSLEMIGNTLIRESRLDIKDPTSVNFADIVQSHCPDAQLATDLRERSLQVQQSNNRNGALLQAMMRLNEQSLAIITGRTEEVTTYQATGQVKKSTLSSRYTQMV